VDARTVLADVSYMLSKLVDRLKITFFFLNFIEISQVRRNISRSAQLDRTTAYMLPTNPPSFIEIEHRLLAEVVFTGIMRQTDGQTDT